jgi:hypothetical protein
VEFKQQETEMVRAARVEEIDDDRLKELAEELDMDRARAESAVEAPLATDSVTTT